MEIKKVKSLVKTMIFAEAKRYCEEHPKWKIPNFVEAQEINKDNCDYVIFWISDTLHNRNLIYNKQNQCIKDNHPLFKNYVVLIENKENK